MPRRLLSTTTLVAALVAGGCAQVPAPPPSPPPAAPAAIQFGGCEDYALTEADRATYAAAAALIECGRLEVPVDHDDPGGDTAQIAVLRVPATGGEPIGSLVLNPGGPGQSGTQFAGLLTLILAQANSPLLQNFDIVGFDPRGVGATIPAVDCFTDQQRDEDEGLTMPTLLPDAGAWTEESAAAFAQQCAAGSGGEEMLAHLGTRDVARDMDLLRQALGDEELTYLGYSYGTRLGAVYAEMFPDNVRALVLDGVMNPTQDTFDRSVDQAAGFQGNFDAMAAWCATDVPDCPLGTDPAAASTRYQEIVLPLQDAPVPAADGRELTYDGAVLGTVNGLYSAVNWPGVVAGVAEVRDGRGDGLLALRDTFATREADGRYGNFLEALLAINCVDEDRHSPERETELRAAVAEVAPIFDDGEVTASVSPCASWPGSSTLGFPYATEIGEQLPPTLVVSVTGDPATPYEGGVRLAEQLRGALLTVEGAQHGSVFVGGSACVDEQVTNYLIDLRTPADGATCSL